ncbi:uncharacterized protein LOC110715424 [Chenopodium quinoa]|uniref:uncharacterized protein LOC110715424 n=1 Tax=Chenopodium quinoa TaxID=63459 RepID=UPI000B790F77|nr:uncharacterized protein LOC110715424 [Chenopodium quinoa]
MENCTPATFPMPKGLKLSKYDGELIPDPEVYRRLVGKLLYLNLSRPDISYSVQQLSQFLSEPTAPHLSTVVHILRYLKGSINMDLFYPANSDMNLIAYSDADWGTCTDTARSLTGYCIFLGNSLIFWKTKKQKVVAKSSTEAEYRSMSHTGDEVVWKIAKLSGLAWHTSFVLGLLVREFALTSVKSSTLQFKKTGGLYLIL